jgi:hypothetical protein
VAAVTGPRSPGRVGDPGGGQAQRVVGWRAGRGGPDNDLLVRVGGAGQRAPVEGELARQRMGQLLDAAAAQADLAVSPPLAELGVVDRQLADQCGEPRVTGGSGRSPCASGRWPGGRPPPVRVAGTQPGVGEQQLDVVAVFLRDLPEVSEQDGGQPVPPQNFGQRADGERRATRWPESGGQRATTLAFGTGQLARENALPTHTEYRLAAFTELMATAIVGARTRTER